jgi:hypothetical protein
MPVQHKIHIDGGKTYLYFLLRMLLPQLFQFRVAPIEPSLRQKVTETLALLVMSERGGGGG